MLEIKKLDSSALYIGFVKSNLANFLSFLLLITMILLFLIPIASRIPAS